MVSSATGHLGFFLFSSKPTAVSEKSHTLTQTIPIFFPLYLGQPVRTTTGLGRFSRSLTFSDDPNVVTGNYLGI